MRPSRGPCRYLICWGHCRERAEKAVGYRCVSTSRGRSISGQRGVSLPANWLQRLKVSEVSERKQGSWDGVGEISLGSFVSSFKFLSPPKCFSSRYITAVTSEPLLGQVSLPTLRSEMFAGLGWECAVAAKLTVTPCHNRISLVTYCRCELKMASYLYVCCLIGPHLLNHLSKNESIKLDISYARDKLFGMAKCA